MGKIKTLVKIATTAGPAVYSIVRTYGPQIRRIMKENPELFETMKNRVSALAGAGSSKRGTAKLKARVGVLREQTTYLYGTANNAMVAEQATAWRKELDLLENSLPVVATMKGKTRRGKIRELESRIDDLAAKILAMTLQDDIEDAEIIEDK
ncbi:hypothetical protein [Trueperella pyogenes]|uniref:Uncharacterized protein n=1 Tax=Trueperella pyogenes TaxID=1661 RepID=A0ABV3NC24_9ACTO|nr:hypothetical protein [Trueperella pyogenes]AHU88709.1 hypothetical protein CQ11_00215 [Trueperella pyogenes]AWA42571.1 hypothetical protein DBV13_00210 [Trueperella pyogenes]AZR00463.1 hypothetical protein EB776_03625 [Trueperella pyogenes]MBB3024591.1 hypothetical protein [Trueperella pyogenes]OQD40403.1 hypothetical protein B1R42_00205 [Trueperella pyogenes]